MSYTIIVQEIEPYKLTAENYSGRGPNRLVIVEAGDQYRPESRVFTHNTVRRELPFGRGYTAYGITEPFNNDRITEVASWTNWEVNAEYHYAGYGELIISLLNMDDWGIYDASTNAFAFMREWQYWTRWHGYKPFLRTPKHGPMAMEGYWLEDFVTPGSTNNNGKHVNLALLFANKYDKEHTALSRLWQDLSLHHGLDYQNNYWAGDPTLAAVLNSSAQGYGGGLRFHRTFDQTAVEEIFLISAVAGKLVVQAFKVDIHDTYEDMLSAEFEESDGLYGQY